MTPKQAGYEVAMMANCGYSPMAIEDRVVQLLAQARAEERSRCANYCGLLAEMMEQGAGELTPGGRLRQAEQTILANNHDGARKDGQ